MSKCSKETSLKYFRTGATRALIATDVLGRGVDIPDVTMVFIYDFPDDIETYIHRVGRTGRNGRPGKAVSLFCPSLLGRISLSGTLWWVTNGWVQKQFAQVTGSTTEADVIEQSFLRRKLIV